jgi:hypothetical protein
MSDIVYVLIIGSVAINGILVGASLDQSIKQLPARHRIGAIAYSAYAKASDLGNGIVWYAILGIGAALLTIVTASVVFTQRNNAPFALPVYIAAVLSIFHSLATTQAAPTMFSQRRYENDEAALTSIFNRFEHWQTIRVVLQLLTLLALLWALLSYAR